MLRRLRADPGTRDIPVVVVTATPLGDADRRQLGELSAHVLTKDAVSREQVLAAVGRRDARDGGSGVSDDRPDTSLILVVDDNEVGRYAQDPHPARSGLRGHRGGDGRRRAPADRRALTAAGRCST